MEKYRKINTEKIVQNKYKVIDYEMYYVLCKLYA